MSGVLDNLRQVFVRHFSVVFLAVFPFSGVYQQMFCVFLKVELFLVFVLFVLVCLFFFWTIFGIGIFAENRFKKKKINIFKFFYYFFKTFFVVVSLPNIYILFYRSEIFVLLYTLESVGEREYQLLNKL